MSTEAVGLRARAGEVVSGHRSAVIVVAAFVVSRAYALAAGVRLDTTQLQVSWQLLDPQILEEGPLGGIFLLHAQPPLFNLVAAALSRLPDVLFDPTVFALWAAMSLVGGLALLAAMLRLQVRPWLATTMVVLFLVSPASILHSHRFGYTEIVVFLVSVSLLLLTRFSFSARPGDLVALTAALALLNLTRSVYHLVLVVMLLGVFWLVRRCEWQQRYLLAALPLLLAGGWAVKNAVVFDSYSNSTWLGLSASNHVQASFTDEEIDQMVDEGVIDAEPRGFSPLGPDDGFEAGSFDNRATDAWTKSTGVPNYNNTAYIDASRQYQADVVRAFRHNPGRYLRSLVDSSFLWLKPADDYFVLAEEREHIEGYANVYDALVLLRPAEVGITEKSASTLRYRAENDISTPLWSEILGSISWTVVLLHGAALLGWAVTVARGRRDGDRRAAAVATVGIILLVFLGLAMNALEVGENNRFRYEAMPVLLLLAALGFEAVARWVGNRRVSTSGAPPA